MISPENRVPLFGIKLAVASRRSLQRGCCAGSACLRSMERRKLRLPARCACRAAASDSFRKLPDAGPAQRLAREFSSAHMMIWSNDPPRRGGYVANRLAGAD
jgi:hypothetical protein